jgi:hypothetical protein
MRVAERGNWLAYAWICERTAPHLYALRSVSRVVEEDQQFEEPIPSEILAKHRQFYAEMLLEDQAKSQSRSAGDSVEQINQTSGKQIGHRLVRNKRLAGANCRARPPGQGRSTRGESGIAEFRSGEAPNGSRLERDRR